MQHQKILVLDFGGQYNQLIARRVRDLGVFCELKPSDMTAAEVRAYAPVGIIFTGGPNSVYEAGAPHIDEEILALGIPVLGICYGAQLIAHLMGGEVARADMGEYGKCTLLIEKEAPMSEGVPYESVCWMSHTDRITALPAGFEVLAKTAACPIAMYGDAARNIYGIQFHPEVVHTRYGTAFLKNFLYNICNAAGDWTMAGFVQEQVEKIRSAVGEGRVLCAMSGGVDSAVAATLVYRAIGKNLTCVFVDNGLHRKGEPEEIMRIFKDGLGMDLIKADAQDLFLDALAGVTDPEQKRKIIGELFIRVFEKEAAKLGKIDYLVQGTIYPDVIESGKGKSATIKSHHNVGGLPADIGFRGIVEPLRDLFKDEVRKVGTELGLPDGVVWRQPCPGPALAIRIMGDVTREKLATVREADAIFREEIERAGLSRDIWQYFAVLTDSKTVGVQGDSRTYENVIALRAITSVDGMTADWARIPFEVLERVSTRITGEVKHANRVVYDITSKPPATIEWE